MAKAQRKGKTATTGSDAGNRSVLIIGGVVVVAVAAVAILFLGGGGSAATAPLERAFEPSELQRAQGISMGSPDAPVQLLEFADFQCPACANFSLRGHPLIKERVIDPGVVRLIRYDFPLFRNHQHAFLAARAARCAGDQDRYWEYHDVLYARQPTWSVQGNPRNNFEEYAAALGLDARRFRDCLRSDAHAEEVTRNLRLGESLNVPGTPTLFLNGQRLDVADYEELIARLYEAAGMSQPGAAAAGADPAEVPGAGLTPAGQPAPAPTTTPGS